MVTSIYASVLVGFILRHKQRESENYSQESLGANIRMSMWI